MFQPPGPVNALQTSLYKLENRWLSSLTQSHFSSWKADILAIHAGFSLSISVRDWKRKTDLNVTLSKNLPDHDSHCLGVLYPRAYKAGGLLYLFSHKGGSAKGGSHRLHSLSIIYHPSSIKGKCSGLKMVSEGHNREMTCTCGLENIPKWLTV